MNKMMKYSMAFCAFVCCFVMHSAMAAAQPARWPHEVRLHGLKQDKATIAAASVLSKALGQRQATLTKDDSRICVFLIKKDVDFKPFGYLLSFSNIGGYLHASQNNDIKTTSPIVGKLAKLWNDKNARINSVGQIVVKYPVVRDDNQLLDRKKKAGNLTALTTNLLNGSLTKDQIIFAKDAFKMAGYPLANGDKKEGRWLLADEFGFVKPGTYSSGTISSGYLIIVSNDACLMIFSDNAQYESGIKRLLVCATMGDAKGKLPSRLAITNMKNVHSASEFVNK